MKKISSTLAALVMFSCFSFAQSNTTQQKPANVKKGYKKGATTGMNSKHDPATSKRTEIKNQTTSNK